MVRLNRSSVSRSARDDDQLLDEVRLYRHASEEQRLKIFMELCDMGAELLSQNPHKDRILAYEDPIPEESRIALDRLRAEYRRE